MPPMQGSTERPARGDDLVTVAAIGVLAYLSETVGHELVGHGSICLLDGGRITALAPLWMRCTTQSLLMVAAGPLLNFVAAFACGLALRLRRHFGRLGLFLWLSCAFNALVACGYLLVGGATTFGDWGVVFAEVHPAWAWRAGCVAVGGGGYLLALAVLKRLYRRLVGAEAQDHRSGWRRTLWPGFAAAVVACAAEVAGGRLAIGPLALAIGCTLVVGWSLSAAVDDAPSSAGEGASVIRFDAAWTVAGLVSAAAFVLAVGPTA